MRRGKTAETGAGVSDLKNGGEAEASPPTRSVSREDRKARKVSWCLFEVPAPKDRHMILPCPSPPPPPGAGTTQTTRSSPTKAGFPENRSCRRWWGSTRRCRSLRMSRIRLSGIDTGAGGVGVPKQIVRE